MQSIVGIGVRIWVFAILVLSCWWLPAQAGAQEVGDVWVEVVAESLEVRQAPDHTSPGMGVLGSGSKLSVLGIYTEADWLQVAYTGPGGRNGWVPAGESAVVVHGDLESVPWLPGPDTNVQFETQAVGENWMEVRVGGLHVREGPDTFYPSLGTVQKGSRMSILGRYPLTGWLQVAYVGPAGERGWVTGNEEFVVVHGDLGAVPQVVEVQPGNVPQRSDLASAAAPPPSSDVAGKLVFQTSSGGDIYIVNADGTGLRKLTTGLDPALSPDGTQVAFARWEGIPRGLFVINVDGTGERLVYGYDKAGLKAPSWSPDGKRIAFTMETGDETRLRFWFRYDRPPGVPKDTGKILVYEGPIHPWWKIATVSVEGGDFKELLGHDFSYSPAWAPNGEEIVYASDQGLFVTGEQDGMGNVLEDWNRWKLTAYQGDRSPTWSPDGSKVALQTRSHDHWEIVVMNEDGQGRTQITRSWPLADRPVNSVAPAWSPDGEWIAYLTDERGEGQWELWKMRPDGSEKGPFLADALAGITFEYNSVDERVVSWGP